MLKRTSSLGLILTNAHAEQKKVVCVRAKPRASVFVRATQSPPPLSCWVTQSHRSCALSAQSNSLTAISIAGNTYTFMEPSSNSTSFEIYSSWKEVSERSYTNVWEAQQCAHRPQEPATSFTFQQAPLCKHQPMAYEPREGRSLKVVQDVSVWLCREKNSRYEGV